VTLPDTALFAQGSATITPALDSFLRSFCVDWLTTLKGFGSSVGDIRVEGHASSEWRPGLSEQEKFLNNMDLSQRRASAVLTRCLRLAGEPDLGRWSRKHLRAVGYSSSKLVIVDGREDERKSRRVVFRAEVDRDRILQGLSEDVQEGQEPPASPVPSRDREASLTLSNLEPPWTEARRIEGKPRIIDGDTIEIGGIKVRLQGLHAPEVADPGGSHAGNFLRELTADGRIVCLLDGTKTYERYVGRCFLDGEDIAEASVRAGFSRDCPRYSKGLYAPFETQAAITSLPLSSYCQ
jgi:endonuclease YncB( thermonuclease family)